MFGDGICFQHHCRLSIVPNDNNVPRKSPNDANPPQKHWGWCGAKSSSSSPVSGTTPKSTEPSTTPKSSPPGPKTKTTLPALLLDNILKKSTHFPPRSPVPSSRREREEKAPAFLFESSSGSGSETLIQEEEEEDEEDEESVQVPVPVPVFSYTSYTTQVNNNDTL